MIKYAIMASFFLLGNCQSQKKMIEKSEIKKTNSQNENFVESKQNVHFELVTNSSINFITAQTGNYYELIKNTNKHVVKIDFNEAKNKGYEDSFYQEIVLFEIDANSNSGKYLNVQLSTVNFLLDKKCYCKGQAGVHKIVKGELNYTKLNNEYSINLSFDHDLITIKNKKIDFKINTKASKD